MLGGVPTFNSYHLAYCQGQLVTDFVSFRRGQVNLILTNKCTSIVWKNGIEIGNMTCFNYSSGKLGGIWGWQLCCEELPQLASCPRFRLLMIWRTESGVSIQWANKFAIEQQVLAKLMTVSEWSDRPIEIIFAEWYCAGLWTAAIWQAICVCLFPVCASSGHSRPSSNFDCSAITCDTQNPQHIRNKAGGCDEWWAR
jgi:hypothetical protein